MTSRLEIDATRLAELLTGPTGPVYRAVHRMAELIVEDVKQNGPVADVEQYQRPPGALRVDMSIRNEVVTENEVRITVGTDPVNPRDRRHYAAIVHRGRAAIDSVNVMKFRRRDGAIRATHHVGKADPRPFLYDAVNRINASSELPFLLIERDE